MYTQQVLLKQNLLLKSNSVKITHTHTIEQTSSTFLMYLLIILIQNKYTYRSLYHRVYMQYVICNICQATLTCRHNILNWLMHNSTIIYFPKIIRCRHVWGIPIQSWYGSDISTWSEPKKWKNVSSEDTIKLVWLII